MALGPTIRSTDLTVALNGFLLLKVLRGRSPFSSSAGTFTFLRVLVAACATICGHLLGVACCRVALQCTAEPRKDCTVHTPLCLGSHSEDRMCYNSNLVSLC